MSDLSTTLTDKEIQQIAEKDDFHIAPYRADGETFGTPTWIWVVETDGELFVRAYNGISSRWYQSAKEQKAGKIEAAGMKKKVRFELISDHKLNEKIEQQIEHFDQQALHYIKARNNFRHKTGALKS